MKRIHWTSEDLETLKSFYADSPAKEISQLLKIPVRIVYQKANSLGLKKSAQFFKSLGSGRIQLLSDLGKLHQFKKGSIPWTKGKKQKDIFTPDQLERIKATQFKPRIIPHNYKPVGSIRINIYGYYEIKVQEGKHNWKLLHRVNWEAENGPIPPKMNIMFKDGNRLNTDLLNLVLRTKSQCMDLNTMHRYPEDLKRSMRLINKLEKSISKVKPGLKPIF